jgi:hypothetical protein
MLARRRNLVRREKAGRNGDAEAERLGIGVVKLLWDGVGDKKEGLRDAGFKGLREVALTILHLEPTPLNTSTFQPFNPSTF